MIECKIRGLFFKSTLMAHLKHKHSISLKEYMEKYSLSKDECFSMEYLEKISVTSRSDKNPFKGHGGRFSPFSKKNERVSEESLIEIKSKIQKKKKENCSESTNLGYWLNKGSSEEEAKQKLSDRQKTFSKEKCIEKFGEVEGLKKFNERREKWQNTLNSKSNEEKIRIAKSKMSKGFSISKNEKEIFENIKHLVTQQFVIQKELKGLYILDFCDQSKKKIIEYNGDFLHCNPAKYDSSYFNKRTKRFATEQWKLDEDKWI